MVIMLNLLWCTACRPANVAEPTEEITEEIIDSGRCSGHFLVYMEDGVIVKIVGEFIW